jgi:glycerol-3-phosphate cytidylyltransferase
MGNKQMKTIITYGTFDTMHYGHISLLRRCKKLGDKLIVGVSTSEFNKKKGKICHHDFKTRRNNVRSLKFVDLVIPESEWEQKNSDIKRYKVDILVMGDDWTGKFDDLPCEVIYLPRTEEISSTLIRNAQLLEKNILHEEEQSNKKYLLSGTYKVPPTPHDEIFPLKEYDFYDKKLMGPNRIDTMDKFYRTSTLKRTGVQDYMKLTYVKFNSKKEWNYNLKQTHVETGEEILAKGKAPHGMKIDFDYYRDGNFCSTTKQGCVYSKDLNKRFKENKLGYVEHRMCCRSKVNRILLDVTELLSKNNITYFIYWGTLLGCLRHQREIPWDRDHDIYILQDQEKEFQKVLRSFASNHEHYYVSSSSSFGLYRVVFSKENKIHLDIWVAKNL